MGKTVLITGAASGIGLECARAFLEKNWNVVSFDINLCPIKNVDSYIVDIRDEKDIRLALQEVKSIDVLVNNAGVYDLNTIDTATSESVDRIIDTNLKGTYLVTKNVLNYIRKTKGSIIFVSSGIGVNVDPTSPLYCATKAGINMLAKCLALSEVEYGVKVNTVLPGPIDTPLLRSAFKNDEELKKYLKDNPTKKLGNPQDVAKAVLFLAGATENSINNLIGTSLEVDGGESISSNLPKAKSELLDESLEERVNNYISKTMLDFDNFVVPSLNKNNLAEDITAKLCAKKWCHIAQFDAAREFTLQKAKNIIEKNLPFIFSFCFGGYKHWWCESSPAPDWAELYNLKYLYEYLAPITAIWKEGVTLEYESEEVGIEMMNNVPDAWQKEYTKIFLKLMDYVKAKVKLPLNFNFVLASDLYDKNQLFKMIEDYLPVVEKRYENLTPKEKVVRVKRAASNILWNGAKDLTKLSDAQKYEYAKESRIKNEAFLDMDYELRGATYFEKENLIPLVGTFGLGAGGEGWLHLASNSSSFVDFWSGMGILEAREDRIIEKIISQSQFEAIKDRLVKVKVNIPELAKIHKNFTYIYVYEGDFII